MNIEERRQLVTAVNHLPQEKINQFIELIQTNEAAIDLFENHKTEIDFEKLKPSTLWKIKELVDLPSQKERLDSSNQESVKEPNQVSSEANTTAECSSRDDVEDTFWLSPAQCGMLMMQDGSTIPSNQIIDVIVDGPKLNLEGFVMNDVLLSASGGNYLAGNSSQELSPEPGPSKKPGTSKNLIFDDSSDSSSEEEFDDPEKTDSGETE